MKSKTHAFMANLLLEDLKRGPPMRISFVRMPGAGALSLPGMGDFVTPLPIHMACIQYQAAFRAGALGPDFYPDLLLGQAVIHPENSGKWLDLLFAESLKWNSLEPLAFVLGYATHYAGDMFGHNYVNAYAGGWFPAFDELVTNPEKAKIAVRHMLVETYMDQKVPASEPMELAVPVDFLMACFASDKARKLYRESAGSIPIVIDRIARLRDGVYELLKDTAVGLIPGVTDYVRHWADDVETGYRVWLEDWARTATIAVSDQPGKLSVAKKLFEDWLFVNLPSMYGMPDAVGKFFKFINDLDLLKPLKDLLMRVFQQYVFALVYAITNISYTDLQKAIADIEKIFKDPKLYLDNGVLFSEKNISQKLDANFGNYGKERDTCRQSFAAVSQCLAMSKLCLIGVDNLNALVSKAGGKVRYASSQTLVTAKIGSVRIKTRDKIGAGTDNNVYFGIVYEGGKQYEVLCDKTGYNDFEQNHDDRYPFQVPGRVDLNRVEKVYVRMSGDTPAGEWDFAWAEIYDDAGQLLFSVSGHNAVAGGTYYCNFTPANTTQSPRSIPFDPRIVSFLYSLDGKGRSNANPAAEKQWEIGFPFYSEPALRAKVFTPLFGV
jgi:hypothetical protein